MVTRQICCFQTWTSDKTHLRWLLPTRGWRIRISTSQFWLSSLILGRMAMRKTKTFQVENLLIESVVWINENLIDKTVYYTKCAVLYMYVYTHSVDSFQHLRCEERQFSGSFCNSAGWLLDQGIGAMLANTTMGHCAASHWSYGDVTLAGSTPSNASLNFCQPLYYLLKPKIKSRQDRWTCSSTSYF